MIFVQKKSTRNNIAMLLDLGSKLCVQNKKLNEKAFNIMINRFKHDARVKKCVQDFIGVCNKPAPDLCVKNTSTNFPLAPRNIEGASNRFAAAMKREFQSRNRNNSANLTKLQENVLHYFMNHREHSKLQTDKNLGPCVMDREECMNQCID